MAIRGAIFDVDGTLLLSNEAHARAWHEAYAQFGYDVPVARVQPLIGMGGDKLMAALTPDLSNTEGVGKEISQRRQQIFLSQYAPSLQPAPGARDLVLHMRDAGLHLVVASSAKRDELDALLKAAHVADLLTETTTSSDAEESKPAPDIVAVALKKAGLAPDEVRMIGDTPYDIESARKAGIGTIAVRCGGTPDEKLAGALAIYDDPADLLAHYDTSPLAEPADHTAQSGTASAQA